MKPPSVALGASYRTVATAHRAVPRHLVSRVLAATVLLLVACSPTLDWRDVRPEGAVVQLQLPCKPHGQSRDLMLAGARVNLALHACAAGAATWGLAVADMVDPALVGPALNELAASAASNLGAPAGAPQAFSVPGATPHAASSLQSLAGRLPDGKAVQMRVAVFARGTRVYQASVLGEQLDEVAAQTFFASLRFQP